MILDYISAKGNGAKQIFYTVSLSNLNVGFALVMEGGYYRYDTNAHRQFTNRYSGCRTTGLSSKITVANNTAADDDNLIKMELRAANTSTNTNFFDFYLDNALSNRVFVFQIRQYRTVYP